MVVDASIVANVLTLLAFIVGTTVFINRFRTDIQVIITRLDAIEKRLDESNHIRLRLQADLEARFNGLEERLRLVEGLAHAKEPSPRKKRTQR